MSNADAQSPAPGGGGLPPPIAESDKAKARKWFQHAKAAADAHSYDYAVELYVAGLAIWPENIEEGLKPLWVTATARKMRGGKPPGFRVTRQHPTSGKDLPKCLNHALFLFGLDPNKIAYMEQILQLATRLKYMRVVQWISPILAAAYDGSKKLPESHYEQSGNAMEQAAALAVDVGEPQIALDILNAWNKVASVWAMHHDNSSEARRHRSAASSKATIVKGKFDKADGFQESVRDSSAQRDLQDADRQMHTADRTTELIERARAEWQANPDLPAKLLRLVDLMTRREDAARENEAIQLLEEEYDRSQNYILHAKADELRMRRLARETRRIEDNLRTNPEDASARAALEAQVRKQLEEEIRIYQERMRAYPTDLHVRFELALRLFRIGRLDEAIPLFQQAQTDGRLRGWCRLHIGQCFIKKQFYDQAIQSLRGALDELDTEGGKLGLELNYWLGRALEADGRADEAKKAYGHLIQFDYNYRDARSRMERIVAEGRT